MTSPSPVNAGYNNGQTIQASDLNAFGSAINTLETFSAQAGLSSEFTLSNTGTLTQIISATLPSNSLAVGSTFRIKCVGTVQFASTSGTLTFTPSVAGVASTMTPQMATQTTGAGPFVFSLEIMIVIRSIGTSGTYMAYGMGSLINSATPVAIVPSTTPAVTTINTTTATPAVSLSAQWATASVSNALKIETAIIERVA